jgi:hypothetical protein
MQICRYKLENNNLNSVLDSNSHTVLRIFHLSLVSQLEPSGTNWIKTKENFASREKISQVQNRLKEVILLGILAVIGLF